MLLVSEAGLTHCMISDVCMTNGDAGCGLCKLWCVDVCVYVFVGDVTVTCSLGNGGCQHRCTDGSDSPVCSCHDKYSLTADRRSCIGEYSKQHYM